MRMVSVVVSNYIKFVGFEVFTALVMKSIIFWDIYPCSPLSVNRRFFS
jgi:branched-subunit amino acid transport protein